MHKVIAILFKELTIYCDKIIHKMKELSAIVLVENTTMIGKERGN